MPLTFASSAFVPVQSMPGWLQAFARNQPVTAAVDATRALLVGGPTTHAVMVSVLWSIGMLVVLSFFAVRKFRRVAEAGVGGRRGHLFSRAQEPEVAGHPSRRPFSLFAGGTTAASLTGPSPTEALRQSQNAKRFLELTGSDTGASEAAVDDDDGGRRDERDFEEGDEEDDEEGGLASLISADRTPQGWTISPAGRQVPVLRFRYRDHGHS